VLDSFPGIVYLNPDCTSNKLKVTTEVIPHSNPGERPPLRTYETVLYLSIHDGSKPRVAARFVACFVHPI
jgi:hypothetical protein